MPYPSIYLQDLAAAIGLVSNEYCFWRNRNNSLQKTERVFAYELYHQFKIHISGRPEYQNLRFDGELTKDVYHSINNCGCSIQDNFELSRNFSPDLVLHNGQSNRISQKLIVEIKTKAASPKAIANDIIKLNHFIQHLGFQHAAFISVNTQFDELKNKLRELFSNAERSSPLINFDKILIFNYNRGILQSKLLSAIVFIDS